MSGPSDFYYLRPMRTPFQVALLTLSLATLTVCSIASAVGPDGFSTDATEQHVSPDTPAVTVEATAVHAYRLVTEVPDPIAMAPVDEDVGGTDNRCLCSFSAAQIFEAPTWYLPGHWTC